ncbi:MAG: hypothetical protein J0I17_09370 ['Candidatus Kapabacteria' thiocyanatum]|uniref:PsbP C-terminal domain-containing protein n=1 Tax=Candidatus Kapaibacterium thiocyanatum TaxID=1895771 RepID=A0A1M3KVD6_9BACT|nr:hypothetical protein ['Candidatus Kapabacteria' thiocyanatum]OJX56359.1 MAG: hypothetical protein BGO89_13580 ['Candidatus Kapabacteria' thiocyanatum]
MEMMRRLSIVVIALTMAGCLFVKAPDEKTEVQNVSLSPLPEVEMSDELVRTRAGDMIALLPKGWLFIDTKGRESSDIIAVAVNPDYTLSAVFSTLPGSEPSKEMLDREGVLGLARVAFNKRSRKTAGSTKLVGSYATAELGPRRFGLYDFSASGGSLRSRCAVFTSSIGNHYEFALVPMTVSGKDLVPDPETQQIFRSILATVQY